MGKRGKIVLYAFITLAAVITAAMLFSFIGMPLSGAKLPKTEQKATKEHARLTAYSFSSGGGMQGGNMFVGIKQADGGAVITFSSAEWHHEDSTVEEYLVPLSVVEDIERVYDEKKMYRYPSLPKSKFLALDAGSSYYSFTFEDNSNTAFSSNQQIPPKGSDGLREIYEIIKNAAAQGERLPGLAKPEVYSGELTDGVCELRVYEYSRGVLKYCLANGTDENITPQGGVTLTRADAPEAPLYADSECPLDLETYPQSCSEGSITPAERLSAGSYVLTAGEYTAQFVIE